MKRVNIKNEKRNKDTGKRKGLEREKDINLTKGKIFKIDLGKLSSIGQINPLIFANTSLKVF